jgi:hypothetical protein
LAVKPVPEDIIKGVNKEQTDRYWNNMLELSMVADAMPAAQLLRVFQGWALCVREGDVPSDASAFGIEVPDHPPTVATNKLTGQEIVAQIIAEHDAEHPVLRDEARLRWAPGVKFE